MRNALTATAVHPTHPQQAGVIDLRGRLRACHVDERAAWFSLQEQLELALQQHAHELHFDEEPSCIRYRIRSTFATTEHQLPLDNPLRTALALLGKQVWPNDADELSHRAWFLIKVAEQDLLFQSDHVKTSGGTAITLRPLYDIKNPLPQLEKIFALPGQANIVRENVQRHKGLILLADTDRTRRVRTARAISQCLTGPDQRILLSETNCHPLVPGVTQIALPVHASEEQKLAWQQACDMSYDVMIALESNHDVAQHAHQKSLVIQGVCTNTPGLALTQLIANGARPESVARSLNSIFTQHGIGLACQYCKCPTIPDERLERWMHRHSPVQSGAISDWLADRLTDNFVQTPGCASCHDTGVGAVTTLVDSIKITADIQEALFDADVRFATHALDQQAGVENQIIALARIGKISFLHAVQYLEKYKFQAH